MTCIHRECVPRYTDGTEVREGDPIRYHQAPGGVFPPGDWQYGVASMFPGELDTHLYLREGKNGRHFGIIGHVIERCVP